MPPRSRSKYLVDRTHGTGRAGASSCLLHSRFCRASPCFCLRRTQLKRRCLGIRLQRSQLYVVSLFFAAVSGLCGVRYALPKFQERHKSLST